MGRIIAIMAIGLTVVIVLSVLAFAGYFKAPGAPPLDTKTHSQQHSGFYGAGSFTGELLESDRIVTNVTNDSMSQSVVMQGEICQQQSGLGKVFFDGSKVTEPDAMYKVYVNGVLFQTFNMEIGDSTPTLTQCLGMDVRSYVIVGSAVGYVHVDLLAYVFDFGSGAGAYQVLASDQATLA